eukprot:scaffold11320_cov121-Isochrysis_galbana.AAC.1
MLAGVAEHRQPRQEHVEEVEEAHGVHIPHGRIHDEERAPRQHAQRAEDDVHRQRRVKECHFAIACPHQQGAEVMTAVTSARPRHVRAGAAVPA